MLRITEDRSNRVDCAAEHLGARPYMTRLVRAEKVGYFEPERQCCTARARYVISLDCSAGYLDAPGRALRDARGEQQGGVPGWRIRIQLDNNLQNQVVTPKW